MANEVAHGRGMFAAKQGVTSLNKRGSTMWWMTWRASATRPDREAAQKVVPPCSGASSNWKQSLKAVRHILAGIAEAKHGQPGVNLGSTWGQPAAPYHDIQNVPSSARVCPSAAPSSV